MLLIHPKKGIDAVISVPGSKSLTNRALIASALAEGTSTLKNASFSADSVIMCDSLKAIGLDVKTNPNTYRITVPGMNPPRFNACKHVTLDLGNCGTAMRFLTAYCCLLNGRFTLTGSRRMLQRPIGRLISALKKNGANVTCSGRNYPPVEINKAKKHRGISGGKVHFDSSESSQFISAMLLTAPYAQKDTTISYSDEIPSQPYIHMTTEVMETFGVRPRLNGNIINVQAGKYYKPCEFAVESDAACANYFFAVAAATRGRIRVRNISPASKQAEIGFIRVLEKIGCAMKYGSNFIECIGPKKLKGIDIDMNSMPDSVPTLAAIASLADAPVRITNIASLRFKETDRIAAIEKEMKKLGVKTLTGHDYITIIPTSPAPGLIHTYDDHRMAMSFAVLGTAVKGISLDDEKCVVKSFPEFFNLLRTL